MHNSKKTSPIYHHPIYGFPIFSKNWMQFYAIAVLGGIGFTLSLFIGDLTFESGVPHYSMRSSVMIGSLISALCGSLLFFYSVKHSNKNL